MYTQIKKTAKRMCKRVFQWLTIMVLATHTAASDTSISDEKVMAILDNYMNALNQLNLNAHVDTLHFPHFRHTKGDVVIWKTPQDFFPLIDATAEQKKAGLRTALGVDWHRSEWIHRKVIQRDSSKLHVATTFVRLRKDGSKIASFDSLYVLTLESGRWAIKGRSSFAPN